MRLIAQAAAPTQRRDPKDGKGSGKRGRGRGRDKKGGRGDKSKDGRRRGPGVGLEGSESEEGFGDDGADWEVYRAMDMRDSDSGETQLCCFNMNIVLGFMHHTCTSGCIGFKLSGQMTFWGSTTFMLVGSAAGQVSRAKVLVHTRSCGSAKWEAYKAMVVRDRESGAAFLFVSCWQFDTQLRLLYVQAFEVLETVVLIGRCTGRWTCETANQVGQLLRCCWC
jgi:hypothetical protein